jgi:hypothetical protein
MKVLLSMALIMFSVQASAQVFFSNTRTGNLIQTHSTVGTSAADAIASASVSNNLLAWKICNDAVNTSTYLFVGEAADPATDGVQLDKGQCFECPNCTAKTLKTIKVKAQAASNGYSVIQFKQQ